MAVIRPTPAKTFTKDNWIFVPTIAAQGAPTAAEVNAAGSLDITLMLFTDGTAAPSKSTNRVQRQRRWGDGQSYEQIGLSSITGGTMLFALDPQAAAGSNGKKAWEKFVVGTTGFLVRRMAIAIATTPVATNFVDVFPVEYDQPFPTTSGDGEAAEAAFASEYAITGPPSFNVAIV